MATDVKNRVNLEDLRIEEDRGGGGGRGLLLLLLVLLVPAAFAAGWLLRENGGDGVVVDSGGALPVKIGEAVRAGSPSAGADFTEGGWVEVPSYHPIMVSSLVPGRVEELLVLEGGEVTEGQVVARLWARDLEDEVRLKEAVVSEARAALDLVTAGYREEDVARALADVDRLAEEVRLAEKVLARTRTLVESGAASREDLDRHETAVATAKARLRAAREEHARLAAGFRVEEVEQARAALARAEADRDLARSKLSYAEVRSPSAGVVLERFVTPGTSLGAGNLRVISLYDPDDLQVRVDVRQENAGRVHVGQAAEVTTEAEPGKAYRAEVIRVEPLADLKKNTIQAKLRIAEPGGRLHPEMICRVRFQAGGAPAGAEESSLLVPVEAVVRQGDRDVVYLVRGGSALRTEVRLGAEIRGRVEVLDGLSEGDRVVLSPPPGLQDGNQVREVER
jgi:multidrug resistance efflux pump